MLKGVAIRSSIPVFRLSNVLNCQSWCKNLASSLWMFTIWQCLSHSYCFSISNMTTSWLLHKKCFVVTNLDRISSDVQWRTAPLRVNLNPNVASHRFPNAVWAAMKAKGQSVTERGSDFRHLEPKRVRSLASIHILERYLWTYYGSTSKCPHLTQIRDWNKPLFTDLLGTQCSSKEKSQ